MINGRSLITFVMATLIYAGALYAQVDVGTLAGIVTDPSGASVPGATVTVVNVATLVQFRTTTNGGGEFVAPNLIPGRYRVVVSRSGFKTLERSDLMIEANARLAVTLTLGVGAVTQTVQVKGEVTPLLQKESSTVTGLLETRQVAELPTVNRTVFDLAVLMPGAVEANQQSNSTGIPDNARAAMGLNANGLGSAQAINTFILDGVNDTDTTGTASYMGVIPPLEAIQEFKIDTSGSAAEMGRGGTTVMMVLKSGTNQLHGSAFEFLRNSSLDARNFFDYVTAATPRRLPNFIQNEFGFTLGGPIRKDRMFFFGDYQGFRQRQGTTWISTVPDAQVRAGDFSNTTQTIYDPATYDAANNTRQAFPGNMILPSRFSPAAKAILNYIPLPNNPSGTLTPLGEGEFFSSSTLDRSQDAFDIKIDDRISERDSFSARFSDGRSHALLPGAWTGLPQFAPAQGQALLQEVSASQYIPGNVSNPSQNAAVGWIHDFNPTTLNEARVSWLRAGNIATQLGYGHNYGDQLGIPNANINNIESGFPGIRIVGVTGIGEGPAYPDTNIENGYEFLDNITLIRASHTIKIGADIDALRQTFFQLLGYPGGSFNFSQDMTASPGNLNTSGNAMASFLLGIPDSANLLALKGSAGLRWWENAGYFQDTWRMTRKLTMDYGLRYEVFTPPIEAHNRMANFDPVTGAMVLPGQGTGCLSTRALMCTDWKNVEPRLGFAYELTPRLIFRTSYTMQAAMGSLKTLGFKTMASPFSATETIENTAVPQQIVRTLDQGYPTSDPFASSSVSNPTGSPWLVNPSYTHPYTQEWSVGFQSELASNLVLELNYVGNAGDHYGGDTSTYNLDVATLGTGPVLERERYYKEDPNLTGITYSDWRDRAHYNSLQATVTKRFGSGLSFMATYAWSHDIGTITAQDQIDETMANTQINAPQRFAANWLYDLPIGRGERLGRNMSPILNGIVGGWRLGGVLQFQSGFPYTVTGGAGHPNRICNGQTPAGGHTVQEWFNTSCFALPTPVTDLVHGGQYVPYGNSGYYILSSDGTREFDLSLAKSFSVGGEGRRFEFRAEAFNVINAPQFLPPLAVIGSGTAGIVTSANPAREIQLALEYTF